MQPPIPTYNPTIADYEAELSRIAEAAMGGVFAYKADLHDVLDHDEGIAIVRAIVEEKEVDFPARFPPTAVRIFTGVVQAMKP